MFSCKQQSGSYGSSPSMISMSAQHCVARPVIVRKSVFRDTAVDQRLPITQPEILYLRLR